MQERVEDEGSGAESRSQGAGDSLGRGAALIAVLQPRRYPSSVLWAKRGAGGERLYGWHSALRAMPQLGEANLVRFTSACLAEAEQIIDRLRAVTPADLS